MSSHSASGDAVGQMPPKPPPAMKKAMTFQMRMSVHSGHVASTENVSATAAAQAAADESGQEGLSKAEAYNKIAGMEKIQVRHSVTHATNTNTKTRLANLCYTRFPTRLCNLCNSHVTLI